MPMADAPDTIMNLDDLAVYVKLSKSSLYKLCQAGKVPGTKIGRTWRFPRDEIERYVRGNHRGAESAELRENEETS